MFDNSSAILRKLRPLELTVLNHFEKQPWSCEIEPSEEEVCPGEEVDINVTNIQDIEGAESREFNRIVVTAYEGDIIGGTEIDAFPKYYAFLVGGGSVTFRYKAPVEGGVSEDKITVFNSCDISRVDQYALEKTMPKDEIKNKTMVIKACYDAIARLVRKEVVTEKGERTITVGGGTNTDKRDYRREIEATAHLMLESTRTLPMPMYGEYYEYYKIKKVQLTSFRATLRDWEYRYHKDENGWNELTEIWEGRDSNVRVYRPSVMFLEMGETYAIFDSETKKAKAVLLGGPSIDYTLNKTLSQEGRGEARTGPHYFTHTESRDESRGFGFDTVDEEKPVINVSNIPSPDFIVTSGDGVNSMAGSGKVTIDDVSHNNRDYTTCKTENTFTWEFKRTKK
jgi:hypothetical protein